MSVASPFDLSSGHQQATIHKISTLGDYIKRSEVNQREENLARSFYALKHRLCFCRAGNHSTDDNNNAVCNASSSLEFARLNITWATGGANQFTWAKKKEFWEEIFVSADRREEGEFRSLTNSCGCVYAVMSFVGGRSCRFLIVLSFNFLWEVVLLLFKCWIVFPRLFHVLFLLLLHFFSYCFALFHRFVVFSLRVCVGFYFVCFCVCFSYYSSEKSVLASHIRYKKKPLGLWLWL